MIAGFIAGKIAKHNEILNGSLTCILCLLLGLVAGLRGKPVTPAWIQITSFFIAPAFGALGGYISMRRKNRNLY
jgi:putative membrane protein (TIGR04086 family)